MRMLKIAFVAACALASASATAGVVPNQPASASKVSTCYYRYSVITPDAIYDVYECYSNGDGTY